MKLILMLTLGPLLFASPAKAYSSDFTKIKIPSQSFRPLYYTGTWKKLNSVISMAGIQYLSGLSESELVELRKRNYQCDKNESREWYCRKVITGDFKLPNEVKVRLWEMAFDSVTLSRSSNEYRLSTETETLNEWQRVQNAEVDKLRFEKLTWRQVTGKTGTTIRLVLSSERHQTERELVLLSPKRFGVVVKIRVPNKKGWNEYWGIVPFDP